MNFGNAMYGMEPEMERIIRDVRARFNEFTYMEIGVETGGTLAGVAALISEKSGWRAVGVDLPAGVKGLRPEQVEQNCTGKHFSVGWIKPNGWNPINPSWNRVSVILCDSRDLFEGMWHESLHLVLIDGDHTFAGCKTDFENVEKYIVSGGVVMIHDYMPYQGPHYDVISACNDLGISQSTREGWHPSRILKADNARTGADMLVLVKK